MEKQPIRALFRNARLRVTTTSHDSGQRAMISRVELTTLHAIDLLELLGCDPGAEGSLTLKKGDDEEIEVDLNDLCMVLQTESFLVRRDDGHPGVVPFKPGVTPQASPN